MSNLSDWIEEYKTEDGHAYNIPDYKMTRIFALEEKLTERDIRIRELEKILRSANKMHKAKNEKLQIAIDALEFIASPFAKWTLEKLDAINE